MEKRKTFSRRLSLYIIGAVGVQFAIIFTIIGVATRKAMDRETRAKAEANLTAQINLIEGRLETVETAVDNMGWIVSKHIGEPEYYFSLTHRLLQSNPNFIGSIVAFKPYFYSEDVRGYAPFSYRQNGKIVSIDYSLGDYDYFSDEWYATPYQTAKKHWSEPYLDTTGSGKVVTTYSCPIIDEKGTFIGVITADIQLEDIAKLLGTIKPFEGSTSFLLSREGHLLDSSEDSDGLFDAFKPIANKMVTRTTGMEYVRLKGLGKSYVVYGPINNGWSTAIVCPKKDIYGGLSKMTMILLILALVFLFTLYFNVHHVVNRETRPITKFSQAADSIAGGNFNTPIPAAEHEDEIMRLRNALDHMQSSLKDYVANLKSTTAEKERYASELYIASEIQRNVLPSKFPKLDGADLWATLKPAKEIGGDLYDFGVDGSRLHFSIGDVSGKGVPAALYTAVTQSAFRFISGMKLGCNGAIARINTVFAERNTAMMFMTLFVGDLNLDTLELRFCNAGHNPIIIIDPDGKASFLKAKTNIAIGIVEDFQYELETLQLSKGSRILLYTDGVTEAENTSSAQYGEDRLLRFAESLPAETDSETFVKALAADVRSFAGGAPQNDDITIFSIKL